MSPVVLVSFIRCDLDGVEIKYWFRHPIRIGWKEITELDAGFGVGTVRCPGRSLRIPIRQALDLDRTPSLVKTIGVRASLHFVCFSPGHDAIYKRYDAE